ncbi:MAG TPA: tetratricopeptide repeat protein [Thermoanaerobaculia bacterium]|nr:tetratricopeptide repeat protein [Thermoanaerobaculia bacterium]
MARQGQRAVVILSLAALALGAGGCDKIRSKQAIKKGNEFFKAQKYETALASYQEAERLDPGQLKLKKNIGLAYMGMYQPGSKHAKDVEFASKAIENLKTYVSHYPDDRKAQEFLVSLYLATDRYDDAISFYEQMLKANPNDSKAMGSIASMYFKKGDFDKGMEWQKKMAALEADKPDPYIMIGVQAWDRSYHYPDLDPAVRSHIVDEGMTALQKALEIKPDSFEALTYVNLLWRERAKMETDPKKAQEDTENANKYLAQALELRKKQQEAAKAAPTPTEPAK